MTPPDRPPGRNAEGGPRPIAPGNRLHTRTQPAKAEVMSRLTDIRAVDALLAVHELLTAMPDPFVVDEHWRRICREMVADARLAAYRAAYDRGYVDGIECRKRVEHQLVDALKEEAETKRRRWHLCCPACRRCGGHRAGCRDCQDRTLETFGQPWHGDYTGGPVAAWDGGRRS